MRARITSTLVSRALLCSLPLAVCLPAQGQFDSYLLDTDSLAISLNGSLVGSLFGTPITGALEGDVARFYVAGDLTLPDATVDPTLPFFKRTFQLRGSRPASLVVGGDLIVSSSDPITIDASGQSGFPGPGGGAGGSGGLGGAGGSGGAGGDWTLIVPLGSGGTGGTGASGSAGLSGSKGPNGKAGAAGGNGTMGTAGTDGFGSPASAGAAATNVGAGGEGGSGGTGGAGGSGGAGGVYFFLGGTNGGNGTGGLAGAVGSVGTNGGRGGNGLGGTNTGTGDTLSGGGGGGGGTGGGGGGGAGGGGNGGTGGGGGGAGGSGITGRGGNGGNGGITNNGGRGGAGSEGVYGGDGGHGGGALELVVLGRATGSLSLAANGGIGLGGDNILSIGLDGSAGSPAAGGAGGGLGTETGGKGGNGGTSGKPGDGGSGGWGGYMGKGGGGGGGTIRLSLAFDDLIAPPSVSVAGGSAGLGGGGNPGGPGRNVTAPPPQAANPFVMGNPACPYLYFVKDETLGNNRPEVYGLLEIPSSFDSITTNAPERATAALLRTTSFDGRTVPGYDFLIYFNLSTREIASPKLLLGASSGPVSLKVGGYGHNPKFGTGEPLTLSALPPRALFVTTAPAVPAQASVAACFEFSGFVRRSASSGSLPLDTPIYLTDEGYIDYDFIADAEGWTLQNIAPAFAAPVGGHYSDLDVLQIGANDNNTNTFGWWESPVESKPAGAAEPLLLVSDWTMSSKQTDAATVPQLRLRVSSTTFQQTDLMTIESNGPAIFSPVATARTQRMYWYPPSASPDFRLFLDLLNFDPGDNANGLINLDRVVVSEIAAGALAGGTTEREYTFSSSTEGFAFKNLTSVFSTAIGTHDASKGRLVMSYQPVTTGGFEFSWWGSTEDPNQAVKPQDGRLYLVDFTVESDQSDASKVPAFRLRVNESRFQASQQMTVASLGNGANSPTLGNPKTYTVVFPAEAAVGGFLIISFDSFMGAGDGDATNAKLYLNNLKVRSVPIP